MLVASNNYWSSTFRNTNASNGNAWNVNTNNGSANNNNTNNSNYVRCVKDMLKTRCVGASYTPKVKDQGNRSQIN
ncbi:MAG: hypothetical protein LBN93_05820 [Candidatus Symbiothrix sp.]|nr:hypothetical protein [Candidatus Symbiothrix sp.]